MKRKRIAYFVLLMTALCLCFGSALAKEEVYYGHVDVRSAGSVILTVHTRNPSDQSVVVSKQTIPVEIKNIKVAADGVEIQMSGQRASESAAYPMEYQSLQRDLRLVESAQIDVTCTFGFVFNGETKQVTGTYHFKPADSNCEGTPKGVDLTITAEKIQEAMLEVLPTPTPMPKQTPDPASCKISTPVPTVTPTVAPTVTPTPVPTVTPVPTATPQCTVTPKPTPTATPTDNVPATGDYTDMWTVIFVVLGVCAIAGIVLVSVKRAHKG